jgi:hypothetical protein
MAGPYSITLGGCLDGGDLVPNVAFWPISTHCVVPLIRPLTGKAEIGCRTARAGSVENAPQPTSIGPVLASDPYCESDQERNHGSCELEIAANYWLQSVLRFPDRLHWR